MVSRRLPFFGHTPMQRAMAAGHLVRTGHALDAHYFAQAGPLDILVRDCCGETDPDSHGEISGHVHTGFEAGAL